MGIHLDKRESTVSLEAGLDDVAEVLEEGNEVVLGSVRSEVADIAGRLPTGGLLNNHIVTLNAVGGEVVMTERSGWSHAHGSHSLLLGDRWLALLVGPVAANCPRSKPFSIHRT